VPRGLGAQGQHSGDSAARDCQNAVGVDHRRTGYGGRFSMAKILFVLTGASFWMMTDGHRRPTGYWADEFVARTSRSAEQPALAFVFTVRLAARVLVADSAVADWANMEGFREKGLSCSQRSLSRFAPMEVQSPT
jgi:hypothetical protein